MDRESVIRGSVAVLGGYGLGDSLIEMVLAQNALRCGYRTTIYSNVLLPLAQWFPGHRLVPSFTAEQAVSERIAAEFAGYDWVFVSHVAEEQIPRQLLDRWVDYERMCPDDRTKVESMVEISRRIFATDHPAGDNGIIAPDRFVRHRFPNRVCIHPTSAEENKNWPPQRFLRLAHRLTGAGFAVSFIMSESETTRWRPFINDAYPLHGFANVADCAGFIYESGYFIGNDSGGGHLASCLGIPTVSIHGRKKKAIKWQPGWGAVEVVTPVFNLVGAFLRQRFWKYLLPVTSVERGFARLVRKSAQYGSERTS